MFFFQVLCFFFQVLCFFLQLFFLFCFVIFKQWLTAVKLPDGKVHRNNIITVLLASRFILSVSLTEATSTSELVGISLIFFPSYPCHSPFLLSPHFNRYYSLSSNNPLFYFKAGGRDRQQVTTIFTSSLTHPTFSLLPGDDSIKSSFGKILYPILHSIVNFQLFLIFYSLYGLPISDLIAISLVNIFYSNQIIV